MAQVDIGQHRSRNLNVREPKAAQVNQDIWMSGFNVCFGDLGCDFAPALIVGLPDFDKPGH